MRHYRIREDKYENRSEFYPQFIEHEEWRTVTGSRGWENYPYNEGKWPTFFVFLSDARDFIDKKMAEDEREKINNEIKETIYHRIK